MDLVEAEATAAPLLLVLDDLQWADVGTVELVDLALGVCREQPLVALAFGRPEIDELFPELWAARSPLVVRLRNLSRRQSEKLVRAVLGADADAALVTRIAEQAEGNAFSLEELMRAAAEGRADVPETVLGMVEARLAALDPEARRVLRAASVFGRTFWAGAVTSLLGGAARTTHVGVLLDVLERGEWVAGRGESSVRGETEYAFRQALVREAAYAMLTDEDRRLGHALAGRWLEKSGADDAVALAEHFEEGGDGARAAVHWARAAEEALEGNALGVAFDRAERGARGGADGELLARLRLLQAEAAFWRGEIVRGLEPSEQAVSLFPERSDAWAEAVTRSAVLSFRSGDVERGVGWSERLAEALTEPEPTPTLLAAGARLAQNNLFARPELAATLLERVEAHASCEDDAFQGHLEATRAIRALFAGDVGSLAELKDRAAAAFERAGRLRNACLERVNAGYALIELGRFHDAAASLRAALVEAERLGLSNVRAAALHNLGWALARSGAAEEGARVEDEAARMSREQGDARMEGACLTYAARIALERGDAPRARDDAGKAVSLLEATPALRAYAHAALADALRRAGDMQAAVAAAREARAALDAHGVEEGEGYVRLVCAELEHAAGDVAAAREAIRAARDGLQERAARISDPERRESFLSRVPEHARTLAMAGEWLSDAT